MKTSISAKPIFLSLMALMICCMSAFAGGEYYQVYLNKKLLFVKHISEPVSVMNLLNKTTPSDVLVIQYSHCGQRGKDRHVSLKDEKGNVVKDWAFSNSKEDMAIPAREITALQQKYGLLTLSYSSAELPNGRTLASLKNNAKSLAVALFDTTFYAVGRWLI